MKIKKMYLSLLSAVFLSSSLNAYAIEFPDVDEVENVNLNTWITDYAQMPTGRNALASARYKDNIYCIGGYSGTRHNKVEVYNITNDSWSEVKEMPTKRSNLVAEQYNGKIYCIGGFNNPTYYSTLEVYDIETNTWETKTPMPTPRRSMASALHNGKIYIGGGINANGYVNTLEVYDIKNDSWSTLANMPTAREGLSAQCYKNKIYFIGGKDSNYLNKLEIYNISTNQWETSVDMPTPRGYISSEIYAGKIYVVGGRNTTTFMDKVEIYDIENNAWSDGVSIPTKRDALISEIYRGKIYAIGGNNGGYRKEVEAYYIYEHPEDKAYRAIRTAQKSRMLDDIIYARELTNDLDESSIKDILQDIISDIYLDDGLEELKYTSNFDVYVKSENMLSISLSTNNVSFENYSGINDLLMDNAVSIDVDSSLSYSVNAYLLSEIKNSNGSNKIDIDRLNIKENSESNYKEFETVNKKLILKDNCNPGNDNLHKIDFKLKGGEAFVADVYKTVVKFEVEQK